MKKIYAVLLTLVVLFTVIYARATYTGYTRKSGNGCTCHGSSANSSVVVEITGPSEILAGATATYQVTISGGSGTAVCVDIAASGGTLSAFDTNLKLSGNELITNGTKTYSSGKYTYTFNYKAPSTTGSQTIYATGLPSKNSGWNFAPDKSVKIVSATDVNNLSIPRNFGLEQNYPNPFNPATSISFTLPFEQEITLKLYDLLGNEVKTIAEGFYSAGKHTINFSAGNLTSGIYIYRIESSKFSASKKLMLLK